jgi:CRP/FNR family cyclic AMP-dependent transcriptional regulator
VPSATPADLEPVPLFGSLADSDLAAIAPWFEVREASPGERLVGEGAAGERFFVISEGEVAVTGLGYKIASLGPGEFFGEIALLGYGQHIATVKASSQARVLVLAKDDFDRLRANYPEVAAEIGAVMQRRLEQLS